MELMAEGGGFERARQLPPGMSGSRLGTTSTAAGSEEPQCFSVDDLVSHPLPGYVVPVGLAWSPDDTVITCLFSPEGTLNRKLYAFDPATRNCELLYSPSGGGVDEASLTPEERLRRERLRERGLGVTRYSWAKSIPRLLVPMPNGIYVADVSPPGAQPHQAQQQHRAGGSANLTLVLPSDPAHPILDPQMSPDGSMIAFVQGDDLMVAPADGSAPPRHLTKGARAGGKSHGLAEYIAQEEMERRTGFWWSPDSRLIAFAQVDVSDVPLYFIPHTQSADPSACEDHAYPFAGKPNARVQLGVVAVRGDGPVVWCECDCGGAAGRPEEEYLARVSWGPESTLWAQIQSRDQRALLLARFDPRTGARTAVHREESAVWVNLHDAFRPLSSARCASSGASLAGGFLWASERTGFRHLYVHGADGRVVGAVTAGQWQVDSLEGVDEEQGLVYFTGTLDSPLERHLYVAPLAAAPPGQAPPAPRRLTNGAGWHTVTMDHSLRRFVDVYDSPESPPRVSLCSISGVELLPVFEQLSPLPRARRLRLRPPEFFQIPAPDGSGVPLHGCLYVPPADTAGPGPFPLVVSVYGGPHAQTCTQSWAVTADVRAQFLCSAGFAVLKLDNRGSSRRGLAFEGTVSRRLGSVEVGDQCAGVAFAVARGVADPARVAIYGWSYGGYLAALSLARAPGVFHAAVAGAPVTSWDGYDTHYTERYMGTPEDNPSGYAESSVLGCAGCIAGDLMLVHGCIDENVHWRHTARLVGALTSAGKRYELMVFPEERHMPRGLRERVYMERRIVDFLCRCLKVAPPVSSFGV